MFSVCINFLFLAFGSDVPFLQSPSPDVILRQYREREVQQHIAAIKILINIGKERGSFVAHMLARELVQIVPRFCCAEAGGDAYCLCLCCNTRLMNDFHSLSNYIFFRKTEEPENLSLQSEFKTLVERTQCCDYFRLISQGLCFFPLAIGMAAHESCENPFNRWREMKKRVFEQMKKNSSPLLPPLLQTMDGDVVEARTVKEIRKLYEKELSRQFLAFLGCVSDEHRENYYINFLAINLERAFLREVLDTAYVQCSFIGEKRHHLTTSELILFLYFLQQFGPADQKNQYASDLEVMTDYYNSCKRVALKTASISFSTVVFCFGHLASIIMEEGFGMECSCCDHGDCVSRCGCCSRDLLRITYYPDPTPFQLRLCSSLKGISEVPFKEKDDEYGVLSCEKSCLERREKRRENVVQLPSDPQSLL